MSVLKTIALLVVIMWFLATLIVAIVSLFGKRKSKSDRIIDSSYILFVISIIILSL